MWIEDLTPCSLFPTDAKTVAVGWLERGRPYAAGPVDRRVYDALVELRRNPWQPFVPAGTHACTLCRFEGEQGAACLFIPAEVVVYVCPELIVHDVNAHGYAPPEPFCRAVLACPPMRSMPYFKAIRASGGAALLRGIVRA
jgi:hypothetical protein